MVKKKKKGVAQEEGDEEEYEESPTVEATKGQTDFDLLGAKGFTTMADGFPATEEALG